jgi:hypothetical protein
VQCGVRVALVPCARPGLRAGVCVGQAIIGPHGGGLQNMVFMRQPGHHGVATWRDDATFGTDVGMGPGDPVPVVIELSQPHRDELFRWCFCYLANALGLRYSLVCDSVALCSPAPLQLRCSSLSRVCLSERLRGKLARALCLVASGLPDGPTRASVAASCCHVDTA